MTAPEILCLGELLVEIMRTEIDIPHREVGRTYRGPFPSGAPANFIDSAARLSKPYNLSTGFVGVIGNDEFGSCIINKFKKDNVDISQIRVDNTQTTGIAFNQYNSDGSRKFIFAAGAAGATHPDDVNSDYFKNIQCLHIMGSALSISEHSKEACYKAIRIAKTANPEVIISFDPNLRPEMMEIDKIIEICEPVLKDTTILLPSGEEAEMLARIEGGEEACKQLLNHGPEIVVLKRGNKGCKIFSSEIIDGIEVPSFKVEEVDPTGAGDAFGGAFIVGYLLNWDLEKTGKFANAAGALKVEFFGPMSDTTYEEVIKLINKK
ncbi:MAG: sugar kinase [Candidatus Lokiarchaeota archaeon]|nr:sugar kinase [Candidatus Lokiarchaeota archaeon]MBD3199527.1 sugar kinase [Candidatus Lokiarchaeota archaeon]